MGTKMQRKLINIFSLIVVLFGAFSPLGELNVQANEWSTYSVDNPNCKYYVNNNTKPVFEGETLDGTAAIYPGGKWDEYLEVGPVVTIDGGYRFLVNSIRNYAFSNSQQNGVNTKNVPKDLVMPSWITDIRVGTFSNAGIETLVIPDTYTGTVNGFNNNPIREVYLGENVLQVATNAFQDTTAGPIAFTAPASTKTRLLNSGTETWGVDDGSTFTFDDGTQYVSTYTQGVGYEWVGVAEETTYTVNYNLGYEGSVEPISKTVEFDEAGLLPADAPTRVGYTFAGWKSPSGTTVANDTKYSDLVENEEITSVTLTALWTKDHVAREIPVNVTLNVEPKEMLESENVRQQFTTADGNDDYCFSLRFIEHGRINFDNFVNAFEYDELAKNFKIQGLKILKEDSLYKPDIGYLTHINAPDHKQIIVDGDKIYRLITDPTTLSEPRPLVWNTETEKIDEVYNMEYEVIDANDLGVSIDTRILTDDEIGYWAGTFEDGIEFSYTATPENKEYREVTKNVVENGGVVNPESDNGGAFSSTLEGFYPGEYAITADTSNLEGQILIVEGKRYLFKNITTKKDTFNPYQNYIDGLTSGFDSAVFDLHFQRLVNIHYELNEGRYDGSDTIDDVEVVADGGMFRTNDTPERVGFRFVGWKVLDEGDTFDPGQDYVYTYGFKDITLEAQWVKDTAEYTVRHHYEKLEGGYEEVEVPDEGTIGKEVSAKLEDRVGFTCDLGIEGTKASGVVLEDGNLALDLYYKRNEYKVTYKEFNRPGIPADVDEKLVKFGTPVNLKEKPTIPGYVMSNWHTSDVDIVGNSGFTMPDKPVTLTGTWARHAGFTWYTIYHCIQELGSFATYSIFEKENVISNVPQNEVIDENVKSYKGFTYGYFYPMQPGVDPQEIELLLFYKRNKHTVSFHETNVPNGRKAEENRTEEYDAPVKIQEPDKIPGYTFSKWDIKAESVDLELTHEDDSHSFAMPDENVQVTGNWEAKEYTVSYDLNCEDATTIEDKTVHWDYDSLLPETEPAREHYNFSGWKVDGYTVDENDKYRDFALNDAQERITLEATWAPKDYKVTYQPGTHGTFSEQEYMVPYGEDTPKFEGDKTGNLGYSFDGWDVYPSEKVTGDATYVAQWSIKVAQPVFIQYVDEDGKTIASTMTVEGKLGDEKTVQAIAIDGYQLALGHPSSYSFTISEKEQEFAFVYMNAPTPDVPKLDTPVPALTPQPITIHYVDDKGNTIHSSLVIHGEIGDIKKVTAPSIEWYTLVTKGATQSFTVSDKKQSFTFVYKREQLKDTMGDEDATSDDESEEVPKVTTSTEDSSSAGTSRNTLPSTAETSSGSSSNNLPTTGETQEMWFLAIGVLLTSVGAVFYIKRKQKV